MTLLKKIDPVEKILLERGKIDLQTLEEVHQNGWHHGRYLGKVLVDHGYINAGALLETLSEALGRPITKLEEFPKDHLPVQDLDFSESYLKEKTIFPLKADAASITLAVFNPFDWTTFDDLRISSSRQLDLVLCTEEDITSAIETYYGLGGSTMDRMVGSITDDDAAVEVDLESTDYIRDMASEAPVIKLVNHIINQAIESGASDIHLEPFADDLALRYRIDGMLYDFEAPPKRLHSAISTRIKIMSKLDISERRLPQDGRIRLKSQGKDIDVR
ncbi:MAG: GspE/PulE family protein, partial [Nitrospinaceae bacterium]